MLSWLLGLPSQPRMGQKLLLRLCHMGGNRFREVKSFAGGCTGGKKQNWKSDPMLAFSNDSCSDQR